MTDDPLTACTVCGAPVQRVFHPVAVHFKGSGFYNTDYGKKKKAGAAAESASKNDSKPDSSSSSKSDSSSKSGLLLQVRLVGLTPYFSRAAKNLRVGWSAAPTIPTCSMPG